MQTTTNLNVCICIHTYQYICTSVHMLEGQPIDAAMVLHIQLHALLHLHIHGTREMTLFLASRMYTVYIYIHIYTYMYDCGSNLLTATLGILSITHFAIPFVPIFFLPYIYIHIHWFCAYTLTHGCCSLIGGFWIKLTIKQA